MLERIENWSVLEQETLSDHQYVEIALKESSQRISRNRIPTQKRWNFVKLDCELFAEVIEFLTSANILENSAQEPEMYADWFMKIMNSACSVAAPLVSRRNRRRQAYWWSAEVAALRGSAVRARRLWSRSRRGGDPVDILAKRKAYAVAKKTLRKAIRKAKNASWAELITTIDSDPWGLPYKLVMGKLHRSSPALSETLEEGTLDKLLNSLFPGGLADQVSPEIPHI